MYLTPMDLSEVSPPPKAFGSKCYIHSIGANQLCVNGALTRVRLDTRRYDILQEFNLAPGAYHFVCADAGLYDIYARVYWSAAGPAGRADLYIYLNGVNIVNEVKVIALGHPMTQDARVTDYFNDFDTIDIRVLQVCGGNKWLMHAQNLTYVIIRRVA